MNKEEQNTDKQPDKQEKTLNRKVEMLKTRKKNADAKSKALTKYRKKTINQAVKKEKEKILKSIKKPMPLSLRQLAFLETYEKTLGNITASCKSAQIAYPTYYKWMNKPNFIKAIEKINPKKQLDDFVVSKMIEAINNGDTTLIKEYLNKRAKSIGLWDEGALDEQLTQINIQIVGENDKEINIETNNKLIEDEL